jgi:hypothetical protein
MSHVRYIDKTREYYLAEGYDKPYQWAHFDDVPFTPLAKPLSKCRATLISTSGIQTTTGCGPRRGADRLLHDSVYTIPSDTPVDTLFSNEGHFDHHETTLEDVNAFFPISRLHEFVEKGRLASLAPHLIGVGTQYSQRRTREQDAAQVLELCREQGVDVAILTPV